jgi:hypothetical protein
MYPIFMPPMRASNGSNPTRGTIPLLVLLLVLPLLPLRLAPHLVLVLPLTRLAPLALLLFVVSDGWKPWHK